MLPIFISYAPDARDIALELNDALNPFALSVAQRHTQLADAIQDAFKLSELEALCFEMDVPYESIPGGDNHAKKVRELILWFEQHGNLPELIAYCGLNRQQKTFPKSAEAINRVAIQQQDDDHAEHIREALKGCEAVAFVASRESVRDGSPSLAHAREAAISYKKPVVVVVPHDVALPPILRERKRFDGKDAAPLAAHLRDHLDWLRTPEGELQTLTERLADAQRDLVTATGEARVRTEREIADLQSEIKAKARAANDAEAAQQRTEARIAAGIEREREPEAPVSGVARTKFINPPPGEAPRYFQDRSSETRWLANFLMDEQRRLMIVIGRGGTGKTAMACRLLKGLERGQLPDDLGACTSDGIVYLSMATSRPINFANLFADLCKLLPKDAAEALDALYKDAKVKTADKMQALLSTFGDRQRVVVLLDNFETLLDAQSNLADAELDEALRAMLKASAHPLKFILTTRDRPFSLMLEQPGRQGKIELDAGLESPFAENLLRGMDADGTVGFKHAPEVLLTKAREHTRGFPRALEALYGIVAADRETSLERILAAPERLPGNVTEALVGEAFNRLDPASRRVMIALAVYARPATANAVDFLLQPYAPGTDSAPLLKRLVGMHFVRSDAGRYYLHSVDRDFALHSLSLQGEGWGEGLRGLKARAADYFVQTRKPREAWKTLDDLAPQLAEFDLRCEAEDWDGAASVLRAIDFDYLLLWGHARLLVRLHQSVLDKVEDATLQMNSLNILGLAHNDLGEVKRAITHYERGLAIARKEQDRRFESAFLGNLGLAYSDLGETRRAIEFYEQALAIDREIGHRRGEGADLGNLGNACSALGETQRAIEFYEQALAIAREIGDRGGEGADLGNLGNRYAELGETRGAIEFYEQALAIAREIGDRRNEGIYLGNLAEALIDEGDCTRAVSFAHDAVVIGEALGDTSVLCGHGCTLALAYLCLGDLLTARTTTDRACAYYAPRLLPLAFAVAGVIALRQDDLAAARAAFEQAIAHADDLLAKNDRAYTARDTKGLALCGLALLTGDSNYAEQSRHAYRAARAINRANGVVGRVLRLLDQLALVAPLPDGVREAAAGE